MRSERIAVITVGVGAGDFSQGYPPMMNFLDKLSADFDIVVYSIHPVNKGFVSATYEIKAPARFIRYSKFRLIHLALLFCFNQLLKPARVVHGFWAYPGGTLAVILGKIFRIPSIVTIQGGEAAAIPAIKYGNMLVPRLKRITLWTCENASCLNAISDFLIARLKQHGLQRNDAVIIPFGSQKTNLHDTLPDRDVLKILHVANLTEVKDQRTLLKAFTSIYKKQPAHLTIIGGDYMNGEIQRYAEELGLKGIIDFKGSIPHDQLLPYYFDAHVMIHCSLHEGQSGVVTDAMARGVVVCGTPVGIISDLGEKYFQIAPIGDADKLCRVVLEVWNNPARLQEIRAEAFAWAQAHDDHWTIRQYKALYQSLMKL